LPHWKKPLNKFSLPVLAASVVAASFAAIFIRLAEAPPLVIATFRLCLASLILLPFVWKRVWPEIRMLSPANLLLCLLSGVFLALHFGLWVSSLSYTSVVTSVVLVTADPVFVAIVSFFLLHESITRKNILGTAVCFIGVGLIAYGNWAAGGNSLLGAVLALLASVAVAGYLIIGRKLRSGISLLPYITLVYSTAALLTLGFTLALGYSLTGYSRNTYFMMLLLAVVPQLIGHSSVNWVLRHVSATLVTIAFLGEPIAATFWAFLIFGESPSMLELLGGFLVLAGIFVAFYRRRTLMRLSGILTQKAEQA
jgi:drug/metabolite transporter (DMT)-like permease